MNRYEPHDRRVGLSAYEQRITWNLFWTCLIAGGILLLLFP